MVVSLFLDGIFLLATAVLDLLDRPRAGYFDLVVILPPQLTGSLQLDPLWIFSSQPQSPEIIPAVHSLIPQFPQQRRVFSQWERASACPQCNQPVFVDRGTARSSSELFLEHHRIPEARQVS